jgi:hypothetical protein
MSNSTDVRGITFGNFPKHEYIYRKEPMTVQKQLGLLPLSKHDAIVARTKRRFNE